MTFDDGICLLNAAKIWGDERVLREVEGCDVIAKEVLYHKSCYGSFTHKKALAQLTAAAVETENVCPVDGQAYLTAFDLLVKYIYFWLQQVCTT